MAAAGLEAEVPAVDGLLALYDGRQLVFAESPWRILTLIRMLLRYWLSWFSFRGAPAAMFSKFEGEEACCDDPVPPRTALEIHAQHLRQPHSTWPTPPGIYPLLDNDTVFERPEQLLQAVGLYDLTQASRRGASGACSPALPAAGLRTGWALAGPPPPGRPPHAAAPPPSPGVYV